jgi:NapH/MauN family ferredoxin-type protein
MIIIIALVIYLALGYGTRSFEAYCPFGGMESLWGLFTAGEFSCALGPLNLSLIIALIALVVLSKKSFCGWACPIGFIGELMNRLGAKIWKKRPSVPAKANFWLKMLRYVVLIVSLYFTYKTGELILRGYDPYYIIFSGFGHGSAGIISVIVTAVIAIGAFIFPMMFCRYLCPLGAVFDPFSRIGLIKITRNDSTCTSCGNCNDACPHDIPVMTLEKIRNRDCTNCLECIDACPEKDTLQIKAGF